MNKVEIEVADGGKCIRRGMVFKNTNDGDIYILCGLETGLRLVCFVDGCPMAPSPISVTDVFNVTDKEWDSICAGNPQYFQLLPEGTKLNLELNYEKE